MTNTQRVEDLEAMIKADTEHLVKALERGDRVHAHGFVDSIIDNCRELEDTEVQAVGGLSRQN